MKPDSSHLLAVANAAQAGAGGGPDPSFGGQPQQQYPQNHPLSGTRYFYFA